MSGGASSHVTTQRGCPFPCTYCAAQNVRQALRAPATPPTTAAAAATTTCWPRSTEIRDRGPLNYIIFLDDTFTIHHPWVREYCRLYQREFAVPFSLHARVETVNESMLHELAAAGCRHIIYGVESGSERVRREIMKRWATNQRFRDVFRWTREAGIMAIANYMIGIPGETRPRCEETIALHHELQPDDFGVFRLLPVPGHGTVPCVPGAGLPAGRLPDAAGQSPPVDPDPAGVTQADIARVYDQWTEIRANAAVERAPGNDPAQVAADIRAAAMLG